MKHSKVIKSGDEISYKELTKFLIKNFEGEGFNNKIITAINNIPKNKYKIKEKLLKLTNMKISNPCYLVSNYDENSCIIAFSNQKVTVQFILLQDKAIFNYYGS